MAARPRKLDLIDPWSHLEQRSDLLGASALLADTARDRDVAFEPPPANAQGDQIFEAVVRRLEGNERVRLHRQYSYKAARASASLWPARLPSPMAAASPRRRTAAAA